LSLAGAWARQPGGGPTMVIVDAVRRETIEQFREVTGELRPLHQTVLASQENGRVIEVLPREGDLVKLGDVVARIDDSLAKLELARAEALVAKWEADSAERQADLEKRDRDLKKFELASSRAGASDTEVADAKSALAVATAKVNQSKAEHASAVAELGLVRRRVEDMTIKAPIGGRISSRRTEVGQWLEKGDPVVEIVQLETIEAWLDVPESIVARLQRSMNAKGAGSESAMKIQIEIPGLGEVRTGELTGIIPRADSMSRLVPARITLLNKDELIRPGMSITGLVPTGTNEPTLTIHKDALLRNDAGAYVYSNAGGVSQIVRVEVLFAVKDRLAVRAERLEPGTEVVVEGNERLFPGTPLATTPMAGPGASKGVPPTAPSPAASETKPPGPDGKSPAKPEGQDKGAKK
ncbi:MAG: efflux RND transporter periplasmic adaptor subunit, partial [Pyrinomonadaceae bacterium]|nr:efflux RND transporter periplasmic adaptor subunit [Phycisphaerales bacterium]